MKKISIIQIPYAPPDGYLDDSDDGEEAVNIHHEIAKTSSSKSLRTPEAVEVHSQVCYEKKAQWLAGSWKLDPFNENYHHPNGSPNGENSATNLNALQTVKCRLIQELN